MRSICMRLMLGGLVLLLAACAASPIKQAEGQNVYTRINLWVDQDEHVTTNYKVGWRLPVNSKVQITDTSADSISVRVLDDGRRFTIANVEGYSGQAISGIYDRYFVESPRDLSGFTAAEREHIRDGELKPGLRKAAVLVARGYPPAHETPSTDADVWKYWASRFDTRLVRFENGRVSDIQN